MSGQGDGEPWGTRGWYLLLALPGLAPGVGLVLHLSVDLALAVAVGAAVAVAVLGAVGAALRLTASARSEAARRVLRGVAAGLAALLAYHGVRLLLWTVADLDHAPFASIEVVGSELVGGGSADWAILTAGIVVHLVVWLGVAVAYSLLASPHPVSGVLVTLVLASLVVVVHPNWYAIEGRFGGFLALTLVGHVAYGAALGAVAAWLNSRPPSASSVHGP